MLTVPADGASSISVAYGTNSGTFDYLTDPTATSGGTAVISLIDLTPKTDYFFQIIRTDAGGKATTSAETKFTTAGFAASLRFIDNHGKPISGISGAIDDTRSSSTISDKNGTMTFTGLDDGQYTVTFRYGKLNYTREFNTETAGDGSDNPSKVITLKDVVNVSKLTGGSASGYTGPVHHSKWPLTLFIVAVLGVAAGVAVWLRRRGRTGTGFLPPHGDYALATLPSASSPIPPIKPPKKIKHSKDVQPPVHLEHVGESLRDMVLKSMHEEAQKRKANKPK
jgi:hypothetical protein